MVSLNYSKKIKKKSKKKSTKKKSKGKPKDPSQKPFKDVGPWLQRNVFPIMEKMKVLPTSKNIYKRVEKILFASKQYVGNSAKNTSNRKLLPEVFLHAMNSALDRPKSKNGLEKEGK